MAASAGDRSSRLATVFERFREKLAEILGMLLGVTVEPGAPRVWTPGDPELRRSLPADALALPLTVGAPGSGSCVIVLPAPLPAAFVKMLEMRSAEEVLERIAEGPALSEAERGTLAEALPLLAAALTDSASSVFGTVDLTASAPLELTGSVWQGGADPLEGRRFNAAALDLSLAEGVSGTLLLLVGEGAFERAGAPEGGDTAAATAPDGNASPVDAAPPPEGSVLVLVEDRSAAAVVLEALADHHPAVVADEGALVRGVLRSRPSALVVEIPEDRTWRLDLLHALRAFPGGQGRRILVLLASPTRDAVVRCLASGLRDILPRSATRDEVRHRVSPAVPAGTPA